MSKITSVLFGVLLLSLALGISSNSVFGAWNTITNMTPSTTSGGFIGNSTHNYTFRGNLNCSYITGGSDDDYCVDAGGSSTFNQTYHDNWQANYSAKTDYINNVTERALFTTTFNSSYLTSYTETDPRWSGNATTVLNWNKTYADTLYYGITNLYGYYNSSTIPAYALITNLVGYLGNWTNDRSNYINTTRAWTNDTNIGISGVKIDWLGTLADGRIASATTWNAKAGTGTCSAGQYASATTTGGVTCSAPPTFNTSYHNNMIANYSAKADYVNNATERALFINTFNASYLTTETEPLWNGNYSLVALLTNQGNWNVNKSNYWDNLDTPLASWTDTFNQTYHTAWINNYSAKTDYVNNASERTLFTSTFNSSYMTNTFNQTYHDSWLTNYSAKTDYVNNQTERALFTSTYNASYDAKPSSTFNSSYHNNMIANYSAKTDYVNNATERTLFLNTFNSSYLTNTSAVTTALTGIGTQAQNLNMGTKNITDITFVNVTNQINVANNLIINGTAICKSGGGCILFT